MWISKLLSSLVKSLCLHLSSVPLVGVQVVIQTLPTMVPATAENGDKITVQLAKIITIPAHQLAQCQLQASTGSNKAGLGASQAGISLLGGPLTVRALAPVSMGPGAQVMRLTVPTQQQQQQQKLVVPQPGSGAELVAVSVANQTVAPQPCRISGVINGSELVIGAPPGRAAPDKVAVQAVQVAVLQQQHAQTNPKTVHSIKSEAPETEAAVQQGAPAVKSEEPEC